jgi:hypothetical protein
VMIVSWVLEGSIEKCTSSGRNSASIAILQHWRGTTALLNGIQVNSALLNGRPPHLSSTQIDKLNFSSIVTSTSALYRKCCSFYGTHVTKWADACLRMHIGYEAPDMLHSFFWRKVWGIIVSFCGDQKHNWNWPQKEVFMHVAMRPKVWKLGKGHK